MSRAERYASGKALRSTCPRESKDQKAIERAVRSGKVKALFGELQ